MQNCYVESSKVKNNHPFLTTEACHTVVREIVCAHLDYANAVFAGLPDCEISKLQRVQNIAAKFVLKLRMIVQNKPDMSFIGCP